MSFFEKLLPSSGLICVAQALKKGFRHYFFEDRDEALAQIEYIDAQGHTVYLAQASFKTDENRKQENAKALKAFFLDIDCGEGKDYPDQKQAAIALTEMVEQTKLPAPAVVISGNGLYAYWFLAKEISVDQWKTIARLLKSTLTAYGFNADPARTSDSASVLRPVGSTHRKDPNNPKKVRLIRDADPIAFSEFTELLKKAAAKKKINTDVVKPPKTNTDINADFYDGIDEGPKANALKIADQCAQIGAFRDKLGDIPEPEWYAGIGVLAYTEQGEDIIHDWSNGHPGYSASGTTEKFLQRLGKATGATTCAHYGTIAPEGCIGCRHINKINSPIRLGMPEPKAKEIEIDSGEIAPPEGFRRAQEGLFCHVDEEWVRFYDQDLYPIQIAFDESVGFEVITIKHYLPHEGWLEFTMRTSLVNDTKGFLTCFYDNHVKVVGTREKKMMMAYIESYAQKLQRERRMAQLMCQMGWKQARDGKPMFVLGKTIFHHDGTAEAAQLANNVPTAAKGFVTAGDLQTWVEATRIFNRRGMEPFLFALLCGFGAPLMKFTGFDGALVSMVGESGAGKTLMLRMLLSIYGNPSELMMMHKDTANALVSRLGVYGTLPLAIDEVTNISGQDLSDLAYRVTQGRDKARLTKNSEERKNLNGWNTLAVVSTNSSLTDRLSSLKHDASAEINRIVEYPVMQLDHFSGETTTKLYWTIAQNYGKAGEVYIQWLTKNAETLKNGVDLVRKKIDAKCAIRGEERFWSATAAAAIYGGAIAKKLGLLNCEVSHMIEWAAETIKDMRGAKAELADTAVGVLGQFLDEHACNRLVIMGDCSPRQKDIPFEGPRGALYIRHEVDNYKMFIPRNVIKQWIYKNNGEYSKIAKELEECKVLVNRGFRKVLGANTTLGGAQQICWMIDIKAPALGAVGLQIVQQGENIKDLKKMEEGR